MLTSADARQVSFLVVHVIADMWRERRFHGVRRCYIRRDSPPPTTLAAAASPSVLLVDDDIELAGLIAQLFRREGIAVQHAATGAAGLARIDAAADRPDLVLLDLMLPDMRASTSFAPCASVRAGCR